MSARPLLLVPAAALLLAACPQQVAPTEKREPPQIEVSPDDPRVVADTSDLYPARDEPAADGPAPGSGVPDETNGVCRLYAPKLPTPECCPKEHGLDAEVVKRACGHPLYLGESHQLTCGYYFDDEDPETKPRWLRLSTTLEPTMEAAVKSHDERISLRVALDPNFKSEPVPGIKGAFWSRHQHLRWAFIPGWSRPRQLSWRDTSCSDEGIKEVIQALIDAPEPPAGARRKSLIPGGPPTPAPEAGENAPAEAAG
jgi:hypothetical protein